MMRMLALVTLLLLSAGGRATTIDFESVPLAPGRAVSPEQFDMGGIHFWSPSSSSNGLVLFTEGATIQATYGRIPVGDVGLLVRGVLCSSGTCYTEPWLRTTASDGSTFSLNSFVAGSDDEILLSGWNGSEGLYATTHDRGAPYDLLVGVDIGNNLTRYYLPTDWIGLEQIDWDTGTDATSTRTYFQLDDIVVNGAFVPIPAAVWLFGSALAGLGWMRRRH